METLKAVIEFFRELPPLIFITVAVLLLMILALLVFGRATPASASSGPRLEWRDNSKKPAPPGELFTSAEREIAISGVTCFRTLDMHRDLILQALNAKKSVCFLLPHPDGQALKLLQTIETFEQLPALLRQSLDLIKSLGLPKFPNFSVRYFHDEFPPFTGFMLDGDIQNATNPDRRATSMLRIQLRGMRSLQHSGLIIVCPWPDIAFDYYAADMRKQWSIARPDPALTQ